MSSFGTTMRYFHHKLPCGRVVSIGFTAPKEKQGKVLMAFSCCSKQDNFSRSDARARLNSRMEHNHPKVMEAEQNPGEHINDVIINAWNNNKIKLTPVAWLNSEYPDGVTIERPHIFAMSAATSAV